MKNKKWFGVFLCFWIIALVSCKGRIRRDSILPYYFYDSVTITNAKVELYDKEDITFRTTFDIRNNGEYGCIRTSCTYNSESMYEVLESSEELIASEYIYNSNRYCFASTLDLPLYKYSVTMPLSSNKNTIVLMDSMKKYLLEKPQEYTIKAINDRETHIVYDELHQDATYVFYSFKKINSSEVSRYNTILGCEMKEAEQKNKYYLDEQQELYIEDDYLKIYGDGEKNALDIGPNETKTMSFLVKRNPPKTTRRFHESYDTIEFGEIYEEYGLEYIDIYTNRVLQNQDDKVETMDFGYRVYRQENATNMLFYLSDHTMSFFHLSQFDILVLGWIVCIIVAILINLIVSVCKNNKKEEPKNVCYYLAGSIGTIINCTMIFVGALLALGETIVLLTMEILGFLIALYLVCMVLLKKKRKGYLLLLCVHIPFLLVFLFQLVVYQEMDLEDIIYYPMIASFLVPFVLSFFECYELKRDKDLFKQ